MFVTVRRWVTPRDIEMRDCKLVRPIHVVCFNVFLSLD